MAHFALLDENNLVVQVCVVDNVNAPGEMPESEILGREYLSQHGFTGLWMQTSYNSRFRGRYAGIGYRYDDELDVFIAPQPFPSWTHDETGEWQPPVPRPSQGQWTWNETNQEWVPVD